MDTDEKKIKEELKRLPEDIRRAIISVDFEKNLQTIAQKNQLHVDQVGALENETLFIMLGTQHPKDYIRNVTRELRVNNDIAKKIALDVNEQIFRPIRESLKKIHNVENAERTQNERGTNAEEMPTPRPATQQKTLNAKPYTLNATQEEHPILRLKRTSEEAKSLLSKTTQDKQKPLAPTRLAEALAKREASSLEPKTGGRGEVTGWPAKDESQKSLRLASPMGQVKVESENKKPLDMVRRSSPQAARGKPFFKVTLQENNRGSGIMNQGKEKQKTEIREKPLQAKRWEPAMPEKEAPAPANLPIETKKDEAPQTGAYPSLKTTERETQNVNRESQDVLPPQKIESAAVQEKLLGSFKLPRAETEYGGGDPYREPVD